MFTVLQLSFFFTFYLNMDSHKVHTFQLISGVYASSGGAWCLVVFLLLRASNYCWSLRRSIHLLRVAKWWWFIISLFINWNISIKIKLWLLGALSGWFLCPFSMPHPVSLFFTFPDFFGTIRCPRLILYSSAPSSGVSHFSKES